MINQDDNFNDGETSSAPSTQSDMATKEGDEKTTIIPKDMCPGMVVGDKITLRITRAGEDQYEAVYEPEGSEDSKEESAPSDSNSDLAETPASPGDSNYE